MHNRIMDGWRRGVGRRSFWMLAALIGLLGARWAAAAPSPARQLGGLFAPSLAQSAYVKASNTGAGDEFGYSVAIDGTTMAVGAPREDSASAGNQGDNSITDAGAVYVYERGPGGWAQQAYLKAAVPRSSAAWAGWGGFGWSVALDGDTLVVGASGDSASGAAYVFVRTYVQGAPVWKQQARLTPFNGDDGDSFGWDVAIDGDTIVVGAHEENGGAAGVNGNPTYNNISRAGAAYVFVRSAGVWTHHSYLKASNPGMHDLFGSSVAIDGDTIVVGAQNESSAATGVNGNQNDDSAPVSGAAYVFVRNQGAWSQQAYLKSGVSSFNQYFGYSDIDGDTIVVGALKRSKAYVFERTGSTWALQGQISGANTEESDVFGWTVSLSGDTLVIGASFESSAATGVDGNGADNSALNSGAAYVFQRGEAGWSQRHYIKASNSQAGDQFGFTVAVSGPNIVIGANQEASAASGSNGNQADNSAASAGAVYAFDLSAATPVTPTATATPVTPTATAPTGTPATPTTTACVPPATTTPVTPTATMPTATHASTASQKRLYLPRLLR
ncbi:MAG TPA: integrin [Herpetosiphonaceae bacterium]|nr:integrin [Herpetosiphonaceae bacterium]